MVVNKRLFLAFASLLGIAVAISCVDNDVDRLFEPTTTTADQGVSGQAGGGGSSTAGSGGGTGASGGTGGGAGTGGGTGTGGSGGCLGAAPSAPPTCTGACKFTKPCDGLDNFLPGLSNVLVTCINTFDFATCDPDKDLVDCANKALSQACPAKAAEDACDKLANSCGTGEDAGAPRELCLSRFNGLSDKSRNLYQSCVQGKCDGNGGVLDEAILDDCIGFLFPTSIGP